MVKVDTNGEVQLVTPGQGPVGNTTWPSAASLVVQVIVASVWVMPVAETADIVGGVVSAGAWVVALAAVD